MLPGPLSRASALSLNTDLHTFIFGAIIMLAVVLLPMGLVALARESWAQRRVSLLETVRAYRL